MERDLRGERPWNPTDRVRRKVLRGLNMRADARGVAQMGRDLKMSQADAAKAMEVAKVAAKRRSKEGARRVNGR